jgi:hypothetical protein
MDPSTLLYLSGVEVWSLLLLLLLLLLCIIIYTILYCTIPEESNEEGIAYESINHNIK